MNCPKCGALVKLDTPNELIACSCTLVRPKVWWLSLQLDINTEIDWTKEKKSEEELPEEISGKQEMPWSD